MTTCFLAPDPIQSTQFIPGGNTPANGGQLFFYVAGSSTKQTVYKDNAAGTAWSNPIVLDSGGNLPSGGEVWFPTGQTFKVIFAPSTDTDPPTSPYWTKDNLAGMNDTAAATVSEWVSGPAPTYVSGTQFTVTGDQTGTFTAGRRIKTTNTAGTVYSVITQAAFGTSTTVNVVSDSGTLDSGLSAVSYGIADPANPSISPQEIYRKGSAVASAGNGTTDVWGVVGDYVHVTGTNAVHSFSTAPYAGARRELIFDGALTLFSSAAMTLPGNTNISTAANDYALVRADTVSTNIVTNYVRASLAPTSSRVKSGTLSVTIAPGASTVAVTSVGFQPNLVYFMAYVGGASCTASWGFDDGAFTSVAHPQIAGFNFTPSVQFLSIGQLAISLITGTSGTFNAQIKTMDALGFTLQTTTSGGSPTTTGAINYIAYS